MTDTTTVDLDAEVKRLRAMRRKALPTDEFVDDFDGIDENGDKYKEKLVLGDKPGVSSTMQVNQTALNQPAPSTTNNMEIIMLDAEMLTEGYELDNPHIPASEEMLDRAHEKLTNEGLEPAWERGL